MKDLTRRAVTDLTGRLEALEEAVEIANGRLDSAQLENARAVVTKGGERLGLGAQHTVAALAGATGSGKSSLFNAIAGADLAEVGVRRPTTGALRACVWGRDDAAPLLDWLNVGRRHGTDGDEDLDGLVLLDLPDYDSIELDHRVEVDRVLELVDLFVWVVDPQKYADAAIHEQYLRPLSRHGAVTVVVLNQADRLEPDDRARCESHLRQLLENDGLRNVPVLVTSARTGIGVESLRRVLVARVAERHAAAERLAADVVGAADDLRVTCGNTPARESLGRRQIGTLVSALSSAAGTEQVVDAVGRSHIHRGVTRTGWFFARWLRRFRADPLRRLHLGQGEVGGRTSLPPPSPVQRARVENAVRRAADEASSELASPWPDVVRTSAMRTAEVLPQLLDKEVSQVSLPARSPSWWAGAGAVQYVFAVTAIAGALWLAALFVIAWLRLPDPPTPKVGELPLPTVLFLGGLAAGIVAAAACRPFLNIGAARRRRWARTRLERAVGAVAGEHVAAPIEEQLRAHNALCAALERAGAVTASESARRNVRTEEATSP
jgi:predicted GTPase